MNAFQTIAIPHKDILEGRLTMDVFAADLWEVFKGRGTDEYKDSQQFFKKTYLTDDLQNIINVVEKRLRGKGGDPVIQIQTPFGGGKTHSMIALYHKAAEWKAKPVVLVGTVMSSKKTLWGQIEEQLEGKIDEMRGFISPGKESTRELFEKHQPLLILIDEALQYVTKAAGLKVQDSNLAAQTMAFIQELTEIAASMEKVSVVISLPASLLEHYDENAEHFFQQLQKVLGREEKIYTPVRDYEISKVIRQRLFQSINERRMSKIVNKFIEYAVKESLIPAGVEPSEYRDMFSNSYPFLPEVIEVLYHRWGSYSTFQRTRGVLRLLASVIYNLQNSNLPYVSLADFNLEGHDIRQELIKHIGPEFNGIVDVDITGKNSGAKKVDGNLGNAYKGLRLGSRTATTIFMYSHSGGKEKGTTLADIKRCATTLANPATVVSEAVEQLSNRLFYLQDQNEKYFFSNQPNLNRIVLTRMENIQEPDLQELEFYFLKNHVQGMRLATYIWPDQPSDIPDNEQLKLVIFRKKDNTLLKQFLETRGNSPRVNRNTLFFLYPLDVEESNFFFALRRLRAYEQIEADETITLSDAQKKRIKEELKKERDNVNDFIYRFYRLVAIPSKEGFAELDLGIPTYGEKRFLNERVYEKLRTENILIEKIAPLVIKEKYLKGKEYVLTQQIYQSSLSTPGETRFNHRMVIENGITEGVRNGLFGLGELDGENPICRFFKEQSTVALSGNEIIIEEGICKKQREDKQPSGKYQPVDIDTGAEGGDEQEGEKSQRAVKETYKNLKLTFKLSSGKVADVMRVINYLNLKYQNIDFELLLQDGEISEQELQDKIIEAFSQMGIEVKIMKYSKDN